MLKWIAKYSTSSSDHNTKLIHIKFETPNEDGTPVEQCEHGELLRDFAITLMVSKDGGRWEPAPNDPLLLYLQMFGMTQARLNKYSEFVLSLNHRLRRMNDTQGSTDTFGTFVARVLNILGIEQIRIGKMFYSVAEGCIEVDKKVATFCTQLNVVPQNATIGEST